MTGTPQFFVVGAQKAGTTALHHQLSHHPGIYMPSLKETHFFDDGHGEYHLGLDHYLRKYFPNATPSKLAGEVDPEYLFFEEVPGRLAGHFPQAKLIFIFREPAARAYSHYLMSYSRGIDRLDFPAALVREEVRMNLRPELVDPKAERIPYVPPTRTEEHGQDLFRHVAQSDFSYFRRGLYGSQVVRYLEHFPRERMLFLLSEELNREPEQTLRRVYEFLDVEYVSPRALEAAERNQATAPRSTVVQDVLLDASPLKAVAKRLLPPGIRANLKRALLAANREAGKPAPLDRATAADLRQRFAADRELLAEIIGRDLTPWA